MQSKNRQTPIARHVHSAQKSGQSIFHFTQLDIRYETIPLVTLIPFSSVSIPADILLYALQVLTVPDLAHQAPEHIRQPLNNKIAALYIMCANLAAVKPRTACTRRTRINRTSCRTILIISTFPVITRQDDTPETLLYSTTPTSVLHAYLAHDYIQISRKLLPKYKRHG